MLSVLVVFGAVSGLLSAFGIALFMTDRYERAMGEPPTEAPPVHVRVIR